MAVEFTIYRKHWTKETIKGKLEEAKSSYQFLIDKLLIMVAMDHKPIKDSEGREIQTFEYLPTEVLMLVDEIEDALIELHHANIANDGYDVEWSED